jgi:hypothetical protein
MLKPKYNIGDFIVNDSDDWASFYPHCQRFRQIGHIGVIIDRKVETNPLCPLYGTWGYLIAFNVGVYCSKAENQIRRDNRILESSKIKLEAIKLIELREIKLNELL